MHITIQISNEGYDYLKLVLVDVFGFQRIYYPQNRGNKDIFVCAYNGSQFIFERNPCVKLNKKEYSRYPITITTVWSDHMYSKIFAELSVRNLLMEDSDFDQGKIRLKIFPQILFKQKSKV